MPMGKVTTYKDLAKALNTKAYRAIGTTLNKNPYAPQVPCHRVVNSNGKVGSFAKGIEEKTKLILKEGIKIHYNKVENFQNLKHKF
ncbi:MAG: MGMT family protein [Nanoarchaeota archaeon]